MKATATAHANIALIKYWGKRDATLNLPAVGSLSLTLRELSTRTSVRFDSALPRDRLLLNGVDTEGEPLLRVRRFLDLVRARSSVRTHAEVESHNNFPTAAGLASSSSGFAALAVAASHAAGLDLGARDLSILARRGSGSAARSIFGGLVGHHCGEREDGVDSFSQPIVHSLPLRMVIATVSERAKTIGSSQGMADCARTSPYYRAWVAAAPGMLEAAKRAISGRDLTALGELTEASALCMHACALSARPAIVYMQGATLDGYHAIVNARKRGIPVWFTCDAGPQIKALTDDAHAREVSHLLATIPQVLRTLVCTPGEPATVVEAPL